VPSETAGVRAASRRSAEEKLPASTETFLERPAMDPTPGGYWARHAKCLARTPFVQRWPAVFAVVVLGALALGGAYSFARMASATAKLEAADDVRGALADLSAALDDAEDAERSYLVTKDPAFRSRFETSRGVFARRMQALRARGGDDRRGLDVVDHDAEGVFGDMARAVAAGSDGTRLLAEDQALAHVRGRIEAMQDDERRVVSARAERSRRRERWTVLAFSACALAIVSIGSATGWQRRRERKRLERAEDRAALLDLADQFIAVLGHDLRNPLGAVTMAGKLIVARAPGEPERTLAERVVRSGERALRMIDDLLDLARSRRSGRIPVARTPGDLRDIVANVVDELRTAHAGRRIEWQWRGDGAGRWDHDRMSQVVSNLVANALVHGAPDERVAVRLRGDREAVSLEVHNFGAAIPLERLPTLFDSYRDRSRVSPSKGLGLGLFIAKQIVLAHGGTIEVTSSAAGTTFTLWFPREPVSGLGHVEARRG